MKGILFILLKVFLLLAIFKFALNRFESSNLYFPYSNLDATPQQVGLPYEDIWLTTPDNVKLHAWSIPASANGALRHITVLFCHGNAGNISHRLDKAKRLHALGLNLFFFDYRGYGGSSGSPSEKGTYTDAETAYLYLLKQKGLKDDQIVLHGESLGGGVAVETALHHPIRALILESAFTSTVAMANRLMPWLPARYLVRYRYDNVIKIPQLRCPILFLHSPQDDIVPFSMAQQNFQAAQAPKQLVELRGDHNEGYIDSGDIYTNAINQFLKQVKSHS